jgi:hypothetical protein
VAPRALALLLAGCLLAACDNVAVTVTIGDPPEAPADTPFDPTDYYNCVDRVGGVFEWGRAPSGCNIEPWGDSVYARQAFGLLIHVDSRDRVDERARYMQETAAVLRDAAAYYLRLRRPAVDDAEVREWQRAVYALAHQESFWTHYREPVSDLRLKMLRGDSGHGHGMLQVDDRYHLPALEDGAGWNLFRNLSYGFDIFFDAWQDAASASCVVATFGSEPYWEERSRSAYSAYNGGPARLCRWTDPDNPFAQNDRGFADKYRARAWRTEIADADHVTRLNVACYLEGGLDCPLLPE